MTNRIFQTLKSRLPDGARAESLATVDAVAAAVAGFKKGADQDRHRRAVHRARQEGRARRVAQVDAGRRASWPSFGQATAPSSQTSGASRMRCAAPL